jgi:hypothetical protein
MPREATAQSKQEQQQQQQQQTHHSRRTLTATMGCSASQQQQQEQNAARGRKRSATASRSVRQCFAAAPRRAQQQQLELNNMLLPIATQSQAGSVQQLAMNRLYAELEERVDTRMHVEARAVKQAPLAVAPVPGPEVAPLNNQTINQSISSSSSALEQRLDALADSEYAVEIANVDANPLCRRFEGKRVRLQYPNNGQWHIEETESGVAIRLARWFGSRLVFSRRTVRECIDTSCEYANHRLQKLALRRGLGFPSAYSSEHKWSTPLLQHSADNADGADGNVPFFTYSGNDLLHKSKLFRVARDVLSSSNNKVRCPVTFLHAIHDEGAYDMQIDSLSAAWHSRLEPLLLEMASTVEFL